MAWTIFSDSGRKHTPQRKTDAHAVFLQPPPFLIAHGMRRMSLSVCLHHFRLGPLRVEDCTAWCRADTPEWVLNRIHLFTICFQGNSGQVVEDEGETQEGKVWAAILGVWTYKNRMASLEGNLRVLLLTSQTPMARWLDKENVEEKRVQEKLKVIELVLLVPPALPSQAGQREQRL